eukprot:15524387-Heterocapsa_arctica.AAC.1
MGRNKHRSSTGYYAWPRQNTRGNSNPAGNTGGDNSVVTTAIAAPSPLYRISTRYRWTTGVCPEEANHPKEYLM